MVDVTIWLAFQAGILSFLSPCCFPLYPSFLAYLFGISASGLSVQRKMVFTTFTNTGFFLVGFSIIFVALGFGDRWIGAWFAEYQDQIRQLGAILVIGLALTLLGLFSRVRWREVNRGIAFFQGITWGGSILIGLTYAAGWTPCIGPIFSAILSQAQVNPLLGAGYLMVYVVGFSIPFLSLALLINTWSWIQQNSRIVRIVSGVLMLLTGILLYMDQMSKITVFLIRMFGGFTGF